MTSRYPSQLQTDYAKTVLPVPDNVISKILIEADDPTFERLCASQEFSSFCSTNSAFSSPIFEERAKRRVNTIFDKSLIQFKPSDMSWQEFDTRMKSFINDYFNGSRSIRKLINEYAYKKGKLMELKMLFEITNVYPNNQALVGAAVNGFLDVLEWISKRFHLSLNQEVVNDLASMGKLPVLQWIYENQSYMLPTNIEALAQTTIHPVPGLTEKRRKVYEWLQSILESR